LRTGRLRHKIIIQYRTATTDGYGGPVQVWTDYATVTAGVDSLSGREFLAAQAAQSEASVRFNMRYVTGVDAEMRIVYNGKLHNILNITDPEERHRELIILTTQGVNEG
jgi:SPP1 family predicted phage head-tail adaptor